MSASPLSCSGVTVRFGAFMALSEVSIAFPAGGIVALIGPNGAGKTTLLNVLSGRQAPTSGRVFLQGRDVTRQPPFRRVRGGLARSFQIINVFGEETVEHNLRLAAQQARLRSPVFWRPVESYAALREDVDAMLERLSLVRQRHRPAAALSHGEQRALEIGLSLMADPPVLLLDEPLAGVGRAELPHFGALLADACRGRTVVVVEHNMDVVMDLADEIVVLVAGRVLKAGKPAEIRADSAVKAAYLGA